MYLSARNKAWKEQRCVNAVNPLWELAAWFALAKVDILSQWVNDGPIQMTEHENTMVSLPEFREVRYDPEWHGRIQTLQFAE